MTDQPPQSSADNPLYQDFLAGAPGRAPIDRWHHYFDVYHRHFQDFRGKQPTVIEIGVQRGGSLGMWQRYFGEGARIFGVDIDPACARHAPPGTRVFIGDQADKAFMTRVLEEAGPPDIVIDDGGHTARQQINTFEVLYPATKIPGVYLVEDTCCALWGGGYDDDPERRNILSHAFRAVLSMHDWMGKRENFRALSVPPNQRKEALPASLLCRTTDSITFYESMVVFTRRHRPEPWNQSCG